MKLVALLTQNHAMPILNNNLYSFTECILITEMLHNQAAIFYKHYTFFSCYYLRPCVSVSNIHGNLNSTLFGCVRICECVCPCLDIVL